MTQITEDYVSFETAKLLKEKGFDCDVNWYYDEFGFGCPTIESKFANLVHIKAPTLQMAMKWLKEVYSLYIELYIIKNYDKKKIEYTYTIQDLKFPGSDDGFDTCKSWDTPEQASEEAIKYCLKNFI